MSKLGTMVTKQSAMLQACCSFTSTGARASATTTNNAQQAATTGDTGPPTTPKAGPFHLFNSSCFAVANRSESSPRLPSKVTYLKKKSNWERYLKDSEKNCQLIVVNFTTKWCNPCQKTNKKIEELREIYKDVNFANIDIDHLLEVAKAWKVEMMPTILLLKRKEDGSKREDNVEKGDRANIAEKGSSGNEGFERGKEGRGKEGSRKVRESDKDGSQRGKKSSKEDEKIKAEVEKFNIVGMLEGSKAIEEVLDFAIQEHRKSIKDN